MSYIILSSSMNILMVVALNYLSGMLLTSVLFRSLAVPLPCSITWDKFLHPSILFISPPSSMLEKPVTSPVPKCNTLMRKRSCNAQSLVLQGVSLVCVVCVLILCFGSSIFQPSGLQRLFLPAVALIIP